jgi:hypothetical protein
MTIIVKLDTAPRDLPPATLYLDDLEEIVQIFRNFGHLSSTEGSEPGSDETQVREYFELGNQVCTEISDLEKIGGAISNLGTRVVVTHGTNRCAFDLRIDRFSTVWTCFGLDEEEKWRAYRRLKAVFELRKRHWRAIFGAFEVLALATFVPLAVIGAVVVLLSHTGKIAQLARLKPPPTSFWMGLPLGLLFAFLIIKNHTIVYLRRRPARGTWTDAIKRNEVWLAAILGAVAGAIAGGAATVVAERLIRKWWP